jgi:hypothetical protein
LGVALRKQSFVEADNSHRSYSNNNTKDCKRRNNMAYRPSAAGAKRGSVKAAIQIFEQNAAVSPSTKNNLALSEDGRMHAVNCSTDESTQPLESAEAKKEPKYHRVKFKREATLVQVNLDCEEVCNGDRTAQPADGNVNGQCQQKTTKFLSNNSEEEHEKFRVKNDRGLNSYSDQAISGQNATVFTVTEGSGRSKSEHNQTKTKPVVPIKKVTKQQINTSVPFSKNNSSDSHCVKETCQLENICDSARNTCMDENIVVRHDKFACPQNSSTMSESSVMKLHTTQGREKLQKGDKMSVAPIRSFLWGASVPCTNQSATVPGTNQFTSVPDTNHSTSIAGSNQTTSVPGTDQMTSVPGVVTKHYEPAKPDNFANLNIYSTDAVYDDVYPPSAVCSSGTSSNHQYSVVQPQDDVYDDVGPPINEVKQCTRSAAFVLVVR